MNESPEWCGYGTIDFAQQTRLTRIFWRKMNFTDYGHTPRGAPYIHPLGDTEKTDLYQMPL